MRSQIFLRYIVRAFPLVLFASISSLSAQPLVNRTVDFEEFGEHRMHGEFDKCGPIDEEKLEFEKMLLGDGWGYGYDRLLADLEAWRWSSYVTIQSIGKTVENRDIWELTITSPQPATTRRHTIMIHARTHPHETQSWWVCEQIIQFLLSEDPFAAFLRNECTFHIIPMYNPDGVEKMTTRYNARGVDLEREWDKPNPEPEAAALKRRFTELMMSEAPIEIALNLHSSSDPERYFWFHDETGTSPTFANLQRQFIDGVRLWFPQIMPWNYRVSWIESTPTHFPESWFWFNFGTDVMALTYEDIYGHDTADSDAHFDSTAWALLRGVADYLDLHMPSSVADERRANGMTLTLFSGAPTRISLTLPSAGDVRMTVHDALGRQIAEPAEEWMEAGTHDLYWESDDVPSGSYFVRVESKSASVVSRLIITR